MRQRPVTVEQLGDPFWVDLTQEAVAWVIETRYHDFRFLDDIRRLLLEPVESLRRQFRDVRPERLKLPEPALLMTAEQHRGLLSCYLRHRLGVRQAWSVGSGDLAELGRLYREQVRSAGVAG